MIRVFLADALLADLQNTVSGSSGNTGYGSLTTSRGTTESVDIDSSSSTPGSRHVINSNKVMYVYICNNVSVCAWRLF